MSPAIRPTRTVSVRSICGAKSSRGKACPTSWENYAQVLASKNTKTGKKKRVQIWPRYQQLDVVRRLLEHARKHGAGKQYLIQHSAGSGRASRSPGWPIN